ncbi:hypothetical protein KMW40_12050 [Enterobacter cloacae]|uniref:hypothetical protein n=1 Tax=Enterobacter cloacae TaxID=550 RepID=UPI0034A27E78
MNINKLTGEELEELLSELEACGIYDRQVRALAELQEYRKAAAEPVYQCEFCHHDSAGELQWHWEDVNKDFYEQYDSERRGNRRVLYVAPPLQTDLEHTETII